MVTPGSGRRTRVRRLVAPLILAALVTTVGCSSSRGSGDADRAPSSSLAPTTVAPPSPSSTLPARALAPTRAEIVTAHPRHDVFAFGTPFHGSTARQRLSAPIVDMAATPTGRGYWLLGSDGGVFTFGDARFYGAGASKGQYVGIVATRSGRGYWLATERGTVHAFGDAWAARPKPKPTGDVVAIDVTRSGRGLVLAAADGAVFGAGDAKSAPKLRGLNRPIVGIATARRGYLLAASDGGVFARSGARFAGSSAAEKLRSPIVDIAGASNGRGYVLVAADGGLFSFETRFLGSGARVALGAKRIVAIAAHPTAAGYWMARGASPDPPPPVVPAPVVRPPPSATNAPVPQPGPPPTPQPAPPATAPPVVAPPALPPPTGGVLAIGDSVMLGAAGALRGAIPGVAVDAVVSRQFGNLPGTLASYRDRGALPGTIIVHLGTNGTVSAGDLDAAMQIAAGRRVIFVNVWVPRSWEAQSNGELAAGAGRWANASLADWRSIAAQGGMVASDGYHMTGAGAGAYAAMLRAAIG